MEKRIEVGDGGLEAKGSKGYLRESVLERQGLEKLRIISMGEGCLPVLLRIGCLN